MTLTVPRRALVRPLRFAPLVPLLVALVACIDPPSPGTSGETAAATGPQGPGGPPAQGSTPGFEGQPIRTETLPGGILVEDFALGEGVEARPGSEVSIHYTGTLDDGTVFDSSIAKGRPFKFTLGQGRVIKGWDQGVPGMKVGGKRRLTIPAELAYGPRARGKIPANSRLTFTLELVDAEAPLPAPKPETAYAGEPLSRVELEGGLIIEEFAAGEGAAASKGDNIEVHYTGKLDDGTVFDSSVPRQKPIGFVLGTGKVIKGWDLGIEGMKVGGLRKLTIPAELAYGERARGKIPANARLTFTVELMRIRAGGPD
jgi:FKBP-type peptidyl-prolyl cis-trans isomerase